MQNKRVVGLDFDDVLMDFCGPLYQFHNKHFGTDLTLDDAKIWDLWKVWNCEQEESELRVMNFYHSDDHQAAAPVTGGPEAVRRLAENNRLVIVTSRPESVRERTLHWLEKHYPNLFEHVCFTNIFHAEGAKRKTKAEACEELGVDIFVDDNLDNAHGIAESGRPVLLLTAPWNEDKTDLHPNITRVHSWDHILEVLG
jgi:uncharacterized HAD superfamily protein